MTIGGSPAAASTSNTGATSRGLFGKDIRAHELVIALVVALLVQVAGVVTARFAGLHREADTKNIDPGIAVPIKVTPVVDLESPVLKLGGKRRKYKLPDKWVRQKPVKRVERKAYVSTKASKTTKKLPPKDLPVADAGTKPPPPDAAVAKKVDIEITEETDAGVANVDQKGHADGDKNGTEVDPLKARAKNMYHGRILGFLTGPFIGQCAALKKQGDFKGCIPSAGVQIAGGTVQSFSFRPCGKGPIDAAARAAIQSLVGQAIPPPPAKYPDLRPNSINVAYVCR